MGREDVDLGSFEALTVFGAIAVWVVLGAFAFRRAHSSGGGVER